MALSEIEYFEMLKDKIVTEMQKSYPGIPDSISEWKGQNIVDFQTELHQKINEHISEKWFYTHMKSEGANLPRIDILNFLSKYTGAKNWEDFKFRNSEGESTGNNIELKRMHYWIPFIVLAVFSLSYFVFNQYYSQQYVFSFYDNDTKQAITNGLIEVNVIAENESPTSYLCDENGSFSFKTNKKKITFVVESPYYYTDTIVRTLNSFNHVEKVKLKLDDYAVMIQYFSKSNVKDWLKRRNDLESVFADNAKIFQVMNESVGMEIYNKYEFINKLTLPTGSLKNIEVIDTRYKEGKITYLRFRQNLAAK